MASKYKKTAQILIGKSTGNGFMPGRIAPGAWVIGAVLLGATPLLRDVAHEGAHEAVQQDAPVIGVGAHDDRLHASIGPGNRDGGGDSCAGRQVLQRVGR